LNEQLEFLKIIATRLADAQLPYMLTGSLAMAMYAEPRKTRGALAIAGLRARDRELTGLRLKRSLLRHMYGRDFTPGQLSEIEIALGQPRNRAE
jgi:hypothetical protein